MMTTRHGTPGADDLWGTNADDILYGGAGNDSLHGGRGMDKLYGDAGNDRLDGGNSDDKLYGGVGNDILHGGDGADAVHGGDGNDAVYADGGSWNTLFGDAGDDKLYGGIGPDYLEGGLGRDVLQGGGGDDTLDGGTTPGAHPDLSTDQLYGGAGNDQIIARGAEHWTVGQGYGAAVGADIVSGGGGADDIHVIGSGSIIDAGDGADRIVTNGGASQLTGGAGADSFEMHYDLGWDTSAPYVTVKDYHAGEDQITLTVRQRDGDQERELIHEAKDLFDRNGDGHISVAGDGLEQHNGLSSATFKTAADGHVTGLELRLDYDGNADHVSQIFIAGSSDFF